MELWPESVARADALDPAADRAVLDRERVVHGEPPVVVALPSMDEAPRSSQRMRMNADTRRRKLALTPTERLGL